MIIDTFTIGASLILVALGALTIAMMRGWVRFVPTDKQVRTGITILNFMLAGAILIAPLEHYAKMSFFILSLMPIVAMIVLEIVRQSEDC